MKFLFKTVGPNSLDRYGTVGSVETTERWIWVYGYTVLKFKKSQNCGGTGTDYTVPANTVQVPTTTGTVTDSGSENTGFIGVISGYIYRTGEL